SATGTGGRRPGCHGGCAQGLAVSLTRALAFATALVVFAGCARPASPLPQVAAPSPTPAPPISFPGDAGPHDGLTEWWYYTGHLHASDGHEYGFEFVIFQTRRQNAPSGYLSHFAISDVDAGRFSHQMRFAQSDAPGAFPLDVNGWRLS